MLDRRTMPSRFNRYLTARAQSGSHPSQGSYSCRSGLSEACVELESGEAAERETG